jgi:hypothetical protein
VRRSALQAVATLGPAAVKAREPVTTLLERPPDDSLAILTPRLADKELVLRERATVAIGCMGRAARAARPQVAQALKTSPDEREQLLLKGCLRELD